MKRVERNRYIAWVMWPVMTGVAFFAGAYIVALLYRLLLAGRFQESVPTLVTIAVSATGLLAALGLVVLFVRYVSKDALTPGLFGLKRLLQWKDIGLGVAGLVLYVLLSMTVLGLVATLVPGFEIDQRQDIGFSTLFGIDQRLAAALLLIVVAPVVEEVIFRGILYSKLRSLRMPVWLVVLVVSASFAALHGQWNVAIDVFVLSAVACVLREVTGTIWPGIMMHAVKNSVAFYMLFVIGALG